MNTSKGKAADDALKAVLVFTGVTCTGILALMLFWSVVDYLLGW